jgi:hypothetical protein
MMYKNGGPAFPTKVYDVEREQLVREEGMTLRDYFAAKAMQGIMSDPSEAQPYTNDQLAQWAYQVADAMLKARDE